MTGHLRLVPSSLLGFCETMSRLQGACSRGIKGNKPTMGGKTYLFAECRALVGRRSPPGRGQVKAPSQMPDGVGLRPWEVESPAGASQGRCSEWASPRC